MMSEEPWSDGKHIFSNPLKIVRFKDKESCCGRCGTQRGAINKESKFTMFNLTSNLKF